mgnify:CR=1 FL=1
MLTTGIPQIVAGIAVFLVCGVAAVFRQGEKAILVPVLFGDGAACGARRLVRK